MMYTCSMIWLSMLLVLLLLGQRNIKVSALQPIRAHQGQSPSPSPAENNKRPIATLHSHEEMRNAFTGSASLESFTSVAVVASLNVLMILFKPNEAVPVQLRLPRVVWELTLIAIAHMTTRTNPTPAVYMLLALTTAGTALCDITAAQIFAFLSQFETCTGGWFSPVLCRSDYAKGYGALLASIQALCTGLFYLSASISAFGAFTSLRDEEIVQRHIRAMQLAAEKSVAQPALFYSP